MIVVVPVLVFVSFSFGEVSMDSPVQSKCIGIISAMQSEVNLLLSQANIERIDTVGKVDYHVGTLRGQQVVIAKAGVGKVLAASEISVQKGAIKPERCVNLREQYRVILFLPRYLSACAVDDNRP